MNICLKTYAKQASPHTCTTNLQERLPARVEKACEITCTFQVTQASDHYLINFEASGDVHIICQRCLGTFLHPYHNQTTLAICPNDEIAEQLMDSYECIVGRGEIDLADILADDLHLFLPEKHLDYSQCDAEISQLIVD